MNDSRLLRLESGRAFLFNSLERDLCRVAQHDLVPAKKAAFDVLDVRLGREIALEFGREIVFVSKRKAEQLHLNYEANADQAFNHLSSIV